MIENPFENYLEVPGYEELYEIDHFGNVRSLDKKVKNKNGYRIIKGKMLKPKLDNHGYLKIGLVKDNQQKFYLIHRLVAITYLSNPNNYPVVNHIDGNPLNNYVENLEWCTYSYNIQHAYNNNLKKGISAEHKGSKNPKSKLNETEVISILNDKKADISIKESYKHYKDKISFSGFEQIWYGYKWKHLVEKVDD